MMHFVFRVDAVSYRDRFGETELRGELVVGQLGCGASISVPTASGPYLTVITSMEGPGPAPPPFIADRIRGAQLCVGVAGVPPGRDVVIGCSALSSDERPEARLTTTQTLFTDPKTGTVYPDKSFAETYRLLPRLRELREALLPLDATRIVAFAACCCERAYPHYAAVVGEERARELLRPHLERLWGHTLGNHITPQVQAAAEEDLMGLPVEDCSGDEDWQAVNALGVVESAYEACIGYSADYAVNAAENCRELVRCPLLDQIAEGMCSIPSAESERIEDAIDSHPLIQAEARWQRELITRLAAIPRLTPEAVAELRKSISRG